MRGRELSDVEVSLTLCSVLDYMEIACDVVAPLIYANKDVIASDVHVALISIHEKKQKENRLFWQKGWTFDLYRLFLIIGFVCSDSVLSARMTKGCAPDSAQVWAAQKRARREQVKKIACLLNTGGRKMI